MPICRNAGGRDTQGRSVRTRLDAMAARAEDGRQVTLRRAAFGWEVAVTHPGGAAVGRVYRSKKDALLALAALTIEWLPLAVVRHLTRDLAADRDPWSA